MSEVETRLAEIRARAERQRKRWPTEANPKLTFPVRDVEFLLDQLARVRTDTIEQCAKAVENAPARWNNIISIMGATAAVRGVSHEH